MELGAGRGGEALVVDLEFSSLLILLCAAVRLFSKFATCCLRALSPAAMAGSAPPPPPPPPPAPAEPELRHGEAPGLDKRTRTRLRRGQVDIEATIDLHGLTRTEAHRALNAFLEGSQNAGRRSVLVITGKGSRGEGVLRDQVPSWLNAEPNRRMIRAFSHAAPKDGGQGALYVLLKRRK